MKLKLKRRKLLALGTAIAAVDSLRGEGFTYAMAKNGKRIAEELEFVAKNLKSSTRFQEYDNKRIELCKKYAEKDDRGKPRMVPQVGGQRGAMEFVGVDSNPEFNSEIEKLKKEYQGELDEREKHIKAYEADLDKEIDFEVYKVKLCNVPKEITVGQLRGIIDLVEDGGINDGEERMSRLPKKG